MLVHWSDTRDFRLWLLLHLWASQVALVVKNLPAQAGDAGKRGEFNPWVGKIPTPVFLPGESHGQRSLADYRPSGHKRVGHHLATKQQVLVAALRISSCGMWDLVPWPVIKPSPLALGAYSLSHWIPREVPWSRSSHLGWQSHLPAMTRPLSQSGSTWRPWFIIPPSQRYKLRFWKRSNWPNSESSGFVPLKLHFYPQWSSVSPQQPEQILLIYSKHLNISSISLPMSSPKQQALCSLPTLLSPGLTPEARRRGRAQQPWVAAPSWRGPIMPTAFVFIAD